MDCVAKLLGVDLGEKFKYGEFEDTYKLTGEGLFHFCTDTNSWERSVLLTEMLQDVSKVNPVPTLSTADFLKLARTLKHECLARQNLKDDEVACTNCPFFDSIMGGYYGECGLASNFPAQWEIQCE